MLMWKFPHHCAFITSHFICVPLFVTLWTIAHQALLSMGFPRQEYCSGLPCPPPVEFPNPGIEPRPLHLLHWQASSLPLASPGKLLIINMLALKNAKKSGDKSFSFLYLPQHSSVLRMGRWTQLMPRNT